MFAQIMDRLLQFLRAGPTEGFWAHITALSPPVGLVDVVDIGHWQATLFMHRQHASQRGATKGRAVICIFAADDNIFIWRALHRPIMPYHADIGVICFRPRSCIKHMVQIVRSKLGQFGRKRDSRHMGGLEKRVVIWQFAHLARSDVGQFTAAVPYVDTPQPRHRIQKPIAVTVCQIDTFG